MITRQSVPRHHVPSIVAAFTFVTACLFGVLPSARLEAQPAFGYHGMKETILEIRHNVPNPFDVSTEIHFWLAKPLSVSMTIFDLSGEEVATILTASLGQGEHVVNWDGRDRSGNQVPSGTYLCQLKSDDEIASRPIIVAR